MDSLSAGEQLLRLAVALAAGMAIGLEREWREKAAGFRTLALVSLGAALFTLYSYRLPSTDDPSRLAAGVVTGIGFLGAGVILRQRRQVLGITTAAAVWVSAALGMGAGFGAWLLTLTGTVAALIVLLVLPLIDVARFAEESRIYKIVGEFGTVEPDQLAALIEGNGLRIQYRSLQRDGDELVAVWKVFGRPEQHRDATHALFTDERLHSVDVLSTPS